MYKLYFLCLLPQFFEAVRYGVGRVDEHGVLAKGEKAVGVTSYFMAKVTAKSFPWLSRTLICDT